jgi:hypothetical protein
MLRRLPLAGWNPFLDDNPSIAVDDDKCSSLPTKRLVRQNAPWLFSILDAWGSPETRLTLNRGTVTLRQKWCKARPDYAICGHMGNASASSKRITRAEFANATRGPILAIIYASYG